MSPPSRRSALYMTVHAAPRTIISPLVMKTEMSNFRSGRTDFTASNGRSHQITSASPAVVLIRRSGRPSKRDEREEQDGRAEHERRSLVRRRATGGHQRAERAARGAEEDAPPPPGPARWLGKIANRRHQVEPADAPR